MRTILSSRPGLLAATALAALAVGLGSPAYAANVLKIDVNGGVGHGVGSLSIAQDGTSNNNIFTTTGLAGGAAIPVRGKWVSLSVTQTGAGNIFKGAGIKSTTASTAATFSAAYGTDADSGNNIHSLSIGQTTTPTDPVVAISVINTDDSAANTITDVLDGSALTYDLTVNGTNNTIANTISASGAVDVDVTVNGGGLLTDANSITNTVTGATSATVTVAVNSDANTVTNTSTGSGAKVISAVLPVGGADGSTISNAFGSVAGAQTSNLSVTGITSRVNFGLTSSAAGTVSNVNLADVVGAAGAAGKLTLSQSGAGSNLALTINGNGFTMGSGLAGGAGVVITQASAASVLDATITAASNGYTYSLTQ